MGLGIDIEDISRFSNMPIEENRKFYEKIFSKSEIFYCTSFSNPYPHFAGIYCAKEALIKATNGKLKAINQIEIKKNNTNKPYADILGFDIEISISHDKNTAVAIAIATLKQ